MGEREQWGTRAGFLLAAVGSAIGLGNIWRFPYVAYDSGGGAFIVPYLVALLTAGIPLLVLEYSVGHRHRGSAPLSFRGLSPRAEVIGWWQVAISFVISTYYAVVIAWALAYAVFSVGLQWGGDPDGFLFGTYLRLADEPGEIGGLVAGVAVPLVLVWAVTLGVLAAGVRKGIEVANKVFIPTLVVVFLVLVVRAVTLEGAATGLNALFRPDWGAITDGGVWIAAYGQIFFSLSIAFAIMITYASYLPRRSDLTNNAFIAGFGNASFELLAGIGVFSAIGFMATSRGIGVGEVATEGVGLAFVTFPEIINTLPALNQTFGLLFFGSLVLAGLSSLVSVVQTYVAGIQEKLGIGRVPAVLAGGGAAAVLSLVQLAEKLRKDGIAANAAGDSAKAWRDFGRADSALAGAEKSDDRWAVPIVLRAVVALAEARAAKTPLLKQPFIEAGLAHAERALTRDPDNLDALEVRGNLRRARWDLQIEKNAESDKLLNDARTDLETVTSRDGTRAQAWVALSSIQAQLKDPDGALISARNAYQQDAFFSSKMISALALMFAFSAPPGLRMETRTSKVVTLSFSTPIGEICVTRPSKTRSRNVSVEKCASSSAAFSAWSKCDSASSLAAMRRPQSITSSTRWSRSSSYSRAMRRAVRAVAFQSMARWLSPWRYSRSWWNSIGMQASS